MFIDPMSHEHNYSFSPFDNYSWMLPGVQFALSIRFILVGILFDDHGPPLHWLAPRFAPLISAIHAWGISEIVIHTYLPLNID